MNAVEKVLYNVGTISLIPRGARIGTTKEFIVIEAASPLQGVWRWHNADSRDRAITTVCREIRMLIAITGLMLDSKHLAGAPGDSRDRCVNELKKIHKLLLGAITGINNLCETYADDADVAGHLKPLMPEIADCSTAITLALGAV